MFRILIMTLVSELALAVMGAGLDPAGLAFVGGFILVIATIPILIVTALLHGIERWAGSSATLIISAFGLLPTLFVFGIAPAMGVRGGDGSYVTALCLAGWFWGAGWYMSAPKRA